MAWLGRDVFFGFDQDGASRRYYDRIGALFSFQAVLCQGPIHGAKLPRK